jgi:hypothetical protein
MNKAVLSLLMLFVICTAMAAQTTMVVGSNFRCDGASQQPIVSFYEFECRGVPLFQGGYKVDTMFWLNNGSPEEWWLGGSLFPSSPYQGAIEEITQFSLPTLHGNLACRQTTPLDGKVTFVVGFTDNNGVAHTGTFSGNWGETLVCGRYGWYAPVLAAGDTLTIN